MTHYFQLFDHWLISYLNRSRSSDALGFFRIAIALFGLFQLLLVSDYILPLYGNQGLMQWVITDTIKSSYLPSIGQIYELLNPLGVSTDECVYAITILYCISLIGLLLGFYTRSMACGAWLFHMIMMNSGFFSLYGVETMTHICLFHVIWMPVGYSYALDSRIRKIVPPSNFMVNVSMLVLQIHVCIIYLNTGIAKALGEQWWNGEAIWRALMQPQFTQFDFSWMAQVSWLAVLLGWSTLAIEIGYAFFIWPHKTRLFWIICTVLLHLAIGICLGLWLFAIIMIIMTMSAFGYETLFRYMNYNRKIVGG